MKKLFAIIFALLSCVFVQASERVIFTCQGVHDKPLGHPTPKSPIQPPTVYIEDYVLTFTDGHPDYVLNIKDEDGDVVYTNTVWSTDTEVILPSTLSGDYEIELIMGNWLFTGWIEL
jgi:hypothetical protein